MAPAKIIFSLVYLGQTNHYRYAYFRLEYINPLLMANTTRLETPNGWTFTRSGLHYLSFDERAIHLPVNLSEPYSQIISVEARDDADARVKLQSFLDAIQEFTNMVSLSGTEVIGSAAATQEVRESLLAMEPNESDEEDEGPAPIFLDDFNPPKISIS